MTKKKCMTEAEWLSQSDLLETRVWYGPEGMLKFLRECKRVRCKVTERKLWLFACACCYRMWDLITNEQCREAVRVTELRADRLVSKKAWWVAQRGLMDKTAFNRTLLPEDDRTWKDQLEAGALQRNYHLQRNSARCNATRLSLPQGRHAAGQSAPQPGQGALSAGEFRIWFPYRSPP
jgi:hypothetical protein